ncbi:MAG: type II toxin-antitoxin system VapC family toxin [Thermoplasmatota archaeon]
MGKKKIPHLELYYPNWPKKKKVRIQWLILKKSDQGHNMYLIDSNVFLQVLLKTSEEKEAKKFLDRNKDQISTTLYNLMEVASVLSRKYKWKKKKITSVLSTMRDSISIHTPDEYDALEAYEITSEILTTPIDTLMITIAKRKKLALVTYDSELLSLNKKYCKIVSP